MRYVNSAYIYSPQNSNVISADNGDYAYHVRMWQHGLKHSHANLMRPFPDFDTRFYPKLLVTDF